MKMYALALVLLAGLLACQEAEQVNPAIYECNLSTASGQHPQAAEFQALLNEVAMVTPGVQVALRTPDGHTWAGAAGMADLPNGIALQPCTQMMVGSISKIFTSVLILQLQDEGVLSVDDPLSQWLDEGLIGAIENAETVTLNHLLNHTSGIRDYLSTEQFINAVNTPYFLETQEEKLQYVYSRPAYHAPGERYTYSNTNYVLLGLVVEAARRMPLWEAVSAFITEPLGLRNTEMGTHSQPIPPGTARPYLATRGNKYYDILQHAVSDGATGDGGIAGNAQDISHFIEALFEGALISDAALVQMTEQRVPTGLEEADFPQWPDEEYGLGLSRWNTPYGTAFGHTGSTSSYNAYLFYFPEPRATLAIAYNGASYDEAVGEQKRAMRERFFQLMLQ